VLQYVAGCGNALQRVAPVRVGVAGSNNTLQHAATRCNTLQHTTLHHIRIAGGGDNIEEIIPLHLTPPHCNTPQHIATHYNTMPNTTLKHTTLQHTFIAGGGDDIEELTPFDLTQSCGVAASVAETQVSFVEIQASFAEIQGAALRCARELIFGGKVSRSSFCLEMHASSAEI